MPVPLHDFFAETGGFLRELVANDVLWVALVSGILAQFSKPFTYYLRTREFDWRHISETGGMPSSHSSLISGLATGFGLEQGFDSPVFALAVIVGMIITYDAAGVRQQAGKHARVLNEIIAELLSGHPIEQTRLNELLGHSRVEVFAGVLFGILVMLLWKLVIQPGFIG